MKVFIKSKKSITGKSSLARKLSSKMTYYYTTIYLIMFLLLLSVLIPILYRDTLTRKTEYNSLISKQFEQFLYIINSDLTSLSASPQLALLLQNYETDSNSQNSAFINLYLQSFSTSDARIQYIVIQNDKNIVFTSFNNTNSNALAFLKNDINYKKVLSGDISQYCSPVISSGLWKSSRASSVYSALNLQMHSHSYTFTIFYNIDEYLNNCAILSHNNFSSLAVLSKNNIPVYSPDKTFCSTLLKMNYEPYTASTNNVLVRPSGIYFCQKIISTGWNVFCFISWINFFSSLFFIIFIIIGVYLISPVLYRLFLVPTTTRFLSPLTELTNAISHYSIGDEISFPIHTDDELEILSTTLNTMSLKLRQQLSDIRHHEREKSATQYRLLATQLDPHFIYNTLSVVNVLARQNNTDAVVNINMALGKILRERLNVKSTIFETIQSELDTIHQYCIIMQYRYTNHVTISSSIDPHLLSEKIPKNILLPIVENAFYHGLTDEEGNIMGSIEISIYEMEHRINIEISDDGIGINREKLDEMKKRNYQIPNTDRSHIGLTNIYDRLQLVYQDKFEFDIESQLEFGTTFSISFPFYDSIQDDIKIFL